MYKIAVLFAVMGACVAQIPLETPEVAYATAAHFAAVADAQARTLIPTPITRAYAPIPAIAPIAPIAPLPIHTPLVDDVKFRAFHPAIPAIAPVLHEPYPYVKSVPLFEDGLYHTDPAGNLVHRLVPAKN